MLKYYQVIKFIEDVDMLYMYQTGYSKCLQLCLKLSNKILLQSSFNEQMGK